ncbi:hypothetical protein F66182_9599 [Fusarium sp. NRRL 66182]|nr:hypothetical protein F66182_9599 [Fusarium sp. NRRL 66182]
MLTPRVFVSGTTGCQGGALTRYLRSKDVEVHALTRNPTSKKAKALEAIGVKLTPSDYDNIEALKESISGCTSLFLVLRPDFTDLTAERRWATNILNAGRAAGVKHAVFSSGFGVDSLDQFTALEPGSFIETIMRNKHAIEVQTRNAGFEYWTILRPGAFMANYLDPFVMMYPGLVERGVLTTAFAPTTVLPLVDTVTIGRFSGEAILNPGRFHQQEISYADDWLEIEIIMQKLSKAVGRELKAEYLSEQEIKAQKDNPFIVGQLMSREIGRLATKEDVEAWGVQLSTLDVFLEREEETVRETYHNSG